MSSKKRKLKKFFKKNQKNNLETKPKELEAKDDIVSPEDLYKVRDTEKKENDIKAALESLYEDQNEDNADYTEITYDKKAKSKRIIAYAIIALIILVGAAIAGFFIFNPNKKFSGGNIKLEVNGPQNAFAGQKINYEIIATNLETVNITQALLQIKLPEAFSLIETVPSPSVISENQTSANFGLGTLKVGQTEKITITGIILGDINSTQVISALLVYKPENFNYEFNEKNSLSTTVDKAPLEVQITSPSQTLVNENVEYKIKIKNASKTDNLGKIRITAVYPEQFKYSASEPQTEKDNNIWEISEILPEQEMEYKFSGTFLAGENEEIKTSQDFKVMIEMISDKNNSYLIETQDFSTKITNESLILNLIINGSSTNSPVNFGEPLYYSINYKNLGDTEIKDINIKASILPSFAKLILWETLEGEKLGKITSSETGKMITWNKDKISSLSSLQPNEEGTIDFYVYLQNYEEFKDVKASDLETAKIKTLLEAEVSDIPQAGASDKDNAVKRTIKGNEMETKLNTYILTTSQGRYYDDDNINVGSGQIPPKVGKETTYQIWWDIKNTTHDLEETKIKAQLGENVIWNNKFTVTAGNLSYDPETNEVTWEINKIPKNTENISIKFDLKIIPKDTDASKLILLLNKAILESKDKETQGKIRIINKVITTNLDDDPNAVGNGIVVP